MADSNQLRIRGQEATVLLVVNGTPLGGSFAKLASWSIKPRVDKSNTGFMGEAEDEPDLIVNGWDLSFTIHEQDNQALDNVWLPIVAAATSSATQTAGLSQPFPTIDIVLVKKYRTGALLPKTLTFSKCVLTLDEQAASDRKSYVTNSFSASCRKMKSL